MTSDNESRSTEVRNAWGVRAAEQGQEQQSTTAESMLTTSNRQSDDGMLTTSNRQSDDGTTSQSQSIRRFFMSTKVQPDLSHHASVRLPPEVDQLSDDDDDDDDNNDGNNGSMAYTESEPAFGNGLFELRDNVASYAGIREDLVNNTENMETLKRLSKGYRKKSEERKIRYMARCKSIRQTAAGSAVFMTLFLTLSCVFFSLQGDLPVYQSVLFAVYTITTAGFGSVKIPKTNGFLLFVCMFIFVGIAALTILVSQVYQYISLETSMAKKNRDKSELAHHGLTALEQTQTNAAEQQQKEEPETVQAAAKKLETLKQSNFRNGRIVSGIIQTANVVKTYVRKSEHSRFIIMFLYLNFLLWGGAIVVMYMEGWRFSQALYFCTYVMTTVGYGDIAPVKKSTNIFVILYLPFSISFVSIYMGNLGRYYMHVTNANTERIRKNLIGLYATKPIPSYEEEIATLKKHPHQRTIHTMNDVVQFIHGNLFSGEKLKTEDKKLFASVFLNLQSVWGDSSVFKANLARQPSFALLVLVQERLIHVIATELAGTDATVAVNDTTFSISVDSLDSTASKWMIPAVAREAFKTVVFDVLLHVGQNRLLTEGADCLLSLSPFELFEIFAPVLAAMADAGTMEGWLGRTEKLASIYFPRSQRLPA